MSFWDSAITGTILNDFVFMVKSLAPDGKGGQVRVWTEGMVFTANASKVTTDPMQVAEAQGAKAVYRITTPKTLVLDFHDVIKRKKDGKVFRITSDGDDMATPDSSTLDMRIVNAEEWVIPNDQG
jgi:hypothetical protein